MTAPRVLVVFGTRPEAIKLAPIVHESLRSGRVQPIVCAVAQHRDLLDQVLELFGITCQHDLNLMRPQQTLAELTGRILTGITGVIEAERPDAVMVQGDTTTVMAAALASFYLRTPVVHVEAGLRSDDLGAPWPEELNRRVATLATELHCAPTTRARDRLLTEGIAPANVCLSGNTVIDALQLVLARLHASPELARTVASHFSGIPAHKPVVLATCHRRESWGDGLEQICLALQAIARRHDVTVVYPVHPNSRVHDPVHQLLGGEANIRLVPPLDYLHFVYLLERCTLVLTDSGGVQEEAPALGKPVLVMRNTTERPEGVEAGVARVVGTTTTGIVDAADLLLTSRAAYAAMAQGISPYGDGRAASRIVQFVADWWQSRNATGSTRDSAFLRDVIVAHADRTAHRQ